MPIVKDKNGKYVVSGKTEDTTPYVPEQPPKPVAKPAAKPQKPWWQQALNNVSYEAKRATNNLSYEAKRVQKDPVGAAVTYGTNVKKAGLAGLELQPQFGVPKAIQRSVTSGGVVNDLKYEASQLRNPARGVGRLTTLASNALLPKFAADELALGSIQATANIARNVTDLGPGDYTQKGFGGIDDAVDEAYRSNARKPPSEMTDDEKSIDDTRASVALQGALTAGTMGLAPLLQGVRFVGPAFQALDPGKAKTVLGFASRFLAAQGLEELPATFLDDNTQGSVLGLFGPNADPVKPGMTRFEAAAAAFLPNMAVAGGMSAPFILGQLKNVRRAKVSESVRSRRQQARDSQKEAGLIQEDPDTGKTAFTEETLQAKPVETPKPGPTYAEAEAEFLQRPEFGDQAATATAEPAVKAEPVEAADPFEQQYDPETPESDALGEVLGEADDDQLLLINQANDGIPQLVEETLTRPGPGYNPDAQLDLVAAPKDSLAKGATAWSDRLGSVPTDTLLSLASNSDELAFKITELTGKELAEFDRLDVISGLRALEGDGIAVMPNRLMGAPLMAVSDIEVDPVRLQFKQGTDAQGQQKGNSLTGVGRWNPDMEGVIQVWTDPMNGKTYVVNGHNRLAKARELGILSVRVEHLDAPTAELARAQGALTNIAQGGGTGFDAAKFFRESGITDPSQLEELGVPMKSGLAVEGIALAKLPDNIFQDAIDGKITKGKAMALGGSGLDEAGMQAAYKALQSRDMSDATFHEVVQQAKSAPTAAGSQVDLFGNTDMLNLMVEKGQLAAAIRAELQKDKSLFARVGKNAGRLEAGGNQIDAAGSQQVAMDAAMVMARFDAEKYADTPLGQLLNEGALQIAEGGKVKPIADRIRRVYGKELEANPAAAKAEEAPAAAEPAAPAPEVRPELKPEERQAVINEIVSKAARNGEVRPPSTPLLETPRESGVSMEKVARDLEEGVLSDDVVKAIDDELRLAEEHKRLDDAMEADRVAAEREAIGYEDMTFEEKKGNGLLDGIAPDPRKAAIQDMLADAEAKGDTTLAREMKNALARLEQKGNGIRTSYYDNFDGDAVTRRQAQSFVDRTKTQSFPDLLLHAEAIYKNAGKTLAGSEALATEAAIAMRDAALIAGVTPDKIKYMDSIDLVGIFGADAAAGAMDAWQPRFADFMRSNPTDPLTSDLGSLSIHGVRVPEEARFGSHRAAIYLALHPALLKRLPAIGTPTAFRKTAFHEAFHSVQDWLFVREGEALMEPAALKEMEAMIKKYDGAWSKDMDAMEIQAEAFGVWASNRKLKFENKGIQSLFERTKQFINSLNQKLRYILKKDPTYVDVFELAYRGDVGRRKYITELTDQQLQGLAKNLDDQMARNIPELTSRIHDYAVAKLDEADRRMQDWENRNNKEGC